MANFPVPEAPQWESEIRKFETSDRAHANLFNAVVQALFNNEVYLLQAIKEAGKNIVKIGPADTELNAGDTLFVVDGMPQVFQAAAYNNISFGADAPADGSYWAPTMLRQEGRQGIGEISVTAGKLAVSEEQDAPKDAAFLAKINV